MGCDGGLLPAPGALPTVGTLRPGRESVSDASIHHSTAPATSHWHRQTADGLGTQRSAAESREPGDRGELAARSFSARLFLAHAFERLGVGLHVHKLAGLVVPLRPRSGEGVLDLGAALDGPNAPIVADLLVLSHGAASRCVTIVTFAGSIQIVTIRKVGSTADGRQRWTESGISPSSWLRAPPPRRSSR